MRITCPNCAAHYEVATSAIPTEGREVECSSCLERWMQMPGGGVAPMVDIPTPEPEDAVVHDITPKNKSKVKAQTEEADLSSSKSSVTEGKWRVPPPPKTDDTSETDSIDELPDVVDINAAAEAAEIAEAEAQAIAEAEAAAIAEAEAQALAEAEAAAIAEA
ncbi:MAG: zinc-ribbon domain-containing protein, partial [Rhodobacteraceae bacterium]|nr:zinc-ribbon domain-containing protein [Paracoccaceae bacterium]